MTSVFSYSYGDLKGYWREGMRKLKDILEKLKETMKGEGIQKETGRGESDVCKI